jgi:hypothetical protein
MRSLFVFILSISFSYILNTQTTNIYNKVDKIAQQIPDSLSKSTDGIAKYINSNFQSQLDKTRASFVWIAKNIRYDIENAFAINFYQNSSEIVSDVLKSRKGICMHFAELFTGILSKVGVKSITVQGYTKQNGFVDYIPHEWCVVQIDSSWVIIDPTWGSGYVQNGKFISQINNYYFIAKPESIIKSHIPFDPMWELLSYPITNQEFYEGKTQINKNKPYFNFNDSILIYMKESDIGKLISSTRRIEKNGVRNSIIFDRVQHNRRELEYYINKQEVEQQNLAVNTYNEAVNSFNNGINLLNQFIDYRNHQFLPKKTDAEINSMLSEPEKMFTSTIVKLNSIKTNDSNLTTSILQLNRSIDEANYNLNEQKIFLNKYFSTGKLLRKSLFYKYSWMGIPLGK